MRIGDRVLLVIAMLLCIATCGYLFAVVWDMLPMQNFVQVLYRISNAWYYRIGLSALLLLLMIGFTKLVFIRTGTKQIPLQDGIPISQNGDVRITVDALRQMCEEIAKQDHRIDLTGCTIASTPQALNIAIKARCQGEQNIPIIVEALQTNIQQMLKRTCGITTAKIQVLVEKADIALPGVSQQPVRNIPVATMPTPDAKNNGEAAATPPQATGEDTQNG